MASRFARPSRLRPLASQCRLTLARRGSLSSSFVRASGTANFQEAPEQWSLGWGGRAAVLLAGATATEICRGRCSQPSSCSSLQRVALGKTSDFEEASMREVPLAETEGHGVVLVHRHGGEFFATSPSCAHYGAQLKKGVSSAGGRGGAPTITCPLHDATFCLRTGQVVRGPSVDGIAAYKTEVKDGMLYAYVPQDVVSGKSKHQKVLRDMAKREKKDQRVFALLGGGAASLAAAETLRQEGFTGRIVMITREQHLPYDRVQLSKQLDKPVEKLQLRPESFFSDYGIEVLRGASVTKLDTKGQVVQYKSAEASNEELRYDKVLVCTGGTPRKLFVPGSDLRNIFTLRTPEDAAEISKLAKKGQKMIVVGGSFIGMEVASSLRKKGCDVAVIAMETVPFERVLGKKVGASFARKLQKEGVEWFGTSQVRLFRGNENVNGVELEDGEVLPADAVVVGAGVLPNTRFVEGLSLDKNGAIIVNPLLQAENCENLYAAGDVCAYPAVRTGQRVRIEHWDVAIQQGRTAAKNMLGKYQPFTTTPFFWSGLFGENLRFVGHAPDALDRVIIEGDVSNMKFISYYTEDDEIRAVATVNQDPVAVAVAELMRRGQMPSVSELMLGTVNADVIMQRLKDLSMKAAPGA